MNDYETLKVFWDNNFKDLSPEAVDSKWIEDAKFNEIINKYVNEESNVLDYGCGSAWAITEVFNTVKFKSGVGIDTSENVIKYDKECAKLINMNNTEFICGDESVLLGIDNKFDFCMSFNCLDVLPDEVIESILKNLSLAMKEGSKLFIGINPDFPKEILEKIGMETKGNIHYKDGVMRGNYKTIEEWNKVFNKYFKVLENFNFALTEREKEYPRIGFLLER